MFRLCLESLGGMSYGVKLNTQIPEEKGYPEAEDMILSTIRCNSPQERGADMRQFPVFGDAVYRRRTLDKVAILRSSVRVSSPARE